MDSNVPSRSIPSGPTCAQCGAFDYGNHSVEACEQRQLLVAVRELAARVAELTLALQTIQKFAS